MTSTSTQCLPNQLKFESIQGRKVIANFSGGRITSDAGIVLLADKNKKLKITPRFAIGFSRLSGPIPCQLFGASVISTKSLWPCFRL